MSNDSERSLWDRIVWGKNGKQKKDSSPAGMIVGGFILFLFGGFIASTFASEPDSSGVGVFVGFTILVIGVAIGLMGIVGGGVKMAVGGSTQDQRSNFADADSRPCPYCAEDIKRSAIKCRYCHQDVPAQ